VAEVIERANGERDVSLDRVRSGRTRTVADDSGVVGLPQRISRAPGAPPADERWLVR
jgi:hypothetical protein